MHPESVMSISHDKFYIPDKSILRNFGKESQKDVIRFKVIN